MQIIGISIFVFLFLRFVGIKTESFKMCSSVRASLQLLLLLLLLLVVVVVVVVVLWGVGYCGLGKYL